jgi:hypothetical protein
LNRAPKKDVMNVTLKEDLSKINTNVTHFKVHGCEAWDHIPDDKHKEMQPKSEQYIFVGYVEDVKCYQLFLPHSLGVIFWIHVLFYELSLAYVPTYSSFRLLSSSSTSLGLVSFMNDDYFLQMMNTN